MHHTHLYILCIGGLLSFIGLATNLSLMSILVVGGTMLAKKEMTPGI